MSQDPVPSSPNSPGWSRWIEKLRNVTAGRFTIIRELGRGGFAAVFLAQQLKPSRRVAIKLLLPSHLDSQWALDHFRGESQKIAEWRHQSVITIYEVHEVEDMLFFVMSYVEGGSLYDVIQLLGPLPIPMARSVLAQMGSALQYAHRQGVTHRDIKPQNVLIDGDGGAVVTDFGISKQAGGTSHTVTGMLFGTPQYMAPEQAESGANSIASDQYALGIVAYEMLTGAPPFSGAPMSVLISHLQDDIPPLRTVRPDCPPELEAAVARMLAKKPSDRFPSVGEAMQAAGVMELPDFHPERQKLGQAARQIAARANATVLDLLSIPPRIEVGDKIPIDATARTMTGEPVASPLELSIDNATIAMLDRERGTLTALEPGSATIVVRSGGIEQTVRVDVVAPQVATIQVAAPTGPLRVGDRAQLTASARSKHGVQIATMPKWTSTNPALATISAEGVLQAHGAGRTLIRAQVDQVTSEFWLEVAAPTVSEVRITGGASALSAGDRRQLSAVVLDTSDNVLADRVVQWSSSDRRVATVSSSGLVTAAAAGPVTITAAVDAATATLKLEIEEIRAALVELLKPPTKINIGDRVRLKAVARDSHGNTIDRAVTWVSEDPAIVRVEADGTVVAERSGSARITATLDGVTAAAEIGVARPAPRQSSPQVAVPAGVVVAKTETAATSAPTVIDAPAIARPAPVRAPAPAPTSEVPEKGSSSKWIGVGIGGVLVAAVAIFLMTRGGSAPAESSQPANTAPSASGGSPPAKTDSSTAIPTKTANAPPPVTPPANASSTGSGAAPAPKRTLAIAASPASLFVGDTVALRAALSDGSTPSGIRWTTRDPVRAMVSQAGVVRALGAGSVTIVATSGTLTDSTKLDVRPRIVAASPAPVVASPPPVITPPRDSAPPVRPNAPPPSEHAAEERQVRQLVGMYAAALTSRKINDVLLYYPKMPKDVQNGWKALFDFARDLQVEYKTEEMDFTSSGVSVHVTGKQTFTNRDLKKRCEIPVSLEMKVTQASNTWQIVDVKQIGQTPGC